MYLWPALIILTGIVVVAVAWPLFRQQRPAGDPGFANEGQLNVYRDQLAEIDADLARGVIGKSEAEAARIELSRRLIAAADSKPLEQRSAVAKQTAAAAEPKVAMNFKGLGPAVAIAVPVIAMGLYLTYGVPGLAGSPRAAKPATQQAAEPGPPNLAQLISQVEARLRDAPEDGRGWDVIGPVYLRDGRFAEARAAFARAIQLLGETPRRLLGLAESAIRASEGRVTDEARAAFEKVLKAEPDRVEPRLWLAIGREQNGELKQAADEYRALLATAAPDAPWRATVVERLAAIAPGQAAGAPTGAGSMPAAVPERGPTADDAAAAASMTPEQRQQMISGMVASLHARLKTNGRDPAGWQRLLRAYAVLGDVPKAKAALAEARAALVEDKPALASIDALATEIGLGS